MGSSCRVDIVQYGIVTLGYIITLATSGLVVRSFIGTSNGSSDVDPEPTDSTDRYDLGAIIGKCENLLTITLILAQAFTGLALIFTAKSIVRGGAIKKDPKYYLGGTLVNFTYSVLMGFLLRILLRATGHPV